MDEAGVGNAEAPRPLWWSDTALLVYLALGKLLIHFWSNGTYGYFRDELYYVACSDHLAWGYVDHPPFSIAVLAATRRLLGDSIFALRLPVVLAGAASVFLTGRMARALGGARFAQWLAALAFLVMPASLAMGSFFSMNAFDLLFWIGMVLILIRMLNTGDPRLWLAFGLVAGFGVLNKISVAFLGFGLVVGLLLTRQRRLLANRWVLVGGAVAALIVLPHIVWQFAYGFPTAEFIRNATAYKITAMSPLQFLQAQVLLAGPLTVPIWLAGLGYLLFARAAERYRVLAIAYLAVLALLIVQHGKAYYLVPAYAMLLAGGAVAIERATESRRWLRLVVGTATALGGVVVAPLAIPLLPPETYVRYTETIGVQPPQEERNAIGALPQHFADRFGWENLVATIAHVYHALPLNDQLACAILGSNYGEAAAVDFFGGRYGLPKAISGHNNYWLWGPRGATGEVVIAVGFPRKELDAAFESVEQAATIESPYAMPSETNLPVYVCRRLRVPLNDAWPKLKRFV